LIRPRFQDELIDREILTKQQIDIFLDKAYKIWRVPVSKVGVRWGTWRKGIGGPSDPLPRLKLEEVNRANKRRNIETDRSFPEFPSPEFPSPEFLFSVKAEEKSDPPQRQEKMKNKVSPPTRTIFASPLPEAQSQPQAIPGANNRMSNEANLTFVTPERSTDTPNIDPEQRELLRRIPWQLFFPPPPPEQCGNGRFRWKCPLRGCPAVIDSASNYVDLFPGFSEDQAECLRSRPDGFKNEMGQDIIYNIHRRHYDFHFKETGVDLIDDEVGMPYLPGHCPNVDFFAAKTCPASLAHSYFPHNDHLLFKIFFGFGGPHTIRSYNGSNLHP
jgi:hypothetical protein